MWFGDLYSAQPVAHAVLLLAIVIVLGLALSAIRVRGVGLGIAGVLFAGIFIGHLGYRMDPSILSYVREFGLILFVFTIGMQLGPGFVASLRREGLRLNLLALAVVILGMVITAAAASLFHIDFVAGAAEYYARNGD